MSRPAHLLDPDDISDNGKEKEVYQKEGKGSDPDFESKYELTYDDCPDKTAFAHPSWKKWTIITVIFVIQCSMNLNASLYGNAVSGLTKHFHISSQAARVGQCVFLVAYAFGCELWAPWSEEFGRWPIMQLSLGLVNLWQIPCALAPNYGTIVVCRFLGGLSSAGGSVTLGMVADMWDADNQQYAVAYIVLSSVGGSVIGPVIGGFIEANLSWHWCFWVQLIFGGATQLVHLIFVPETRTTIMLDREAKKRRKENPGANVWGPNEIHTPRISMKEVLTIWYRPFEMFVCEPIVLCLSLLSGFSDALIFTFLEAYTPVYKQWDFSVVATGLAFLPQVPTTCICQTLANMRDKTLGWIFHRLFLLLSRHCQPTQEASRRPRLFTTRSSALVVAVHRSFLISRSIRLRMDIVGARLRHTMDSTYDILGNGRYCQLRHIYGHD